MSIQDNIFWTDPKRVRELLLVVKLKIAVKLLVVGSGPQSKTHTIWVWAAAAARESKKWALFWSQGNWKPGSWLAPNENIISGSCKEGARAVRNDESWRHDSQGNERRRRLRELWVVWWIRGKSGRIKARRKNEPTRKRWPPPNNHYHQPHHLRAPSLDVNNIAGPSGNNFSDGQKMFFTWLVSIKIENSLTVIFTGSIFFPIESYPLYFCFSRNRFDTVFSI